MEGRKDGQTDKAATIYSPFGQHKKHYKSMLLSFSKGIYEHYLQFVFHILKTKNCAKLQIYVNMATKPSHYLEFTYSIIPSEKKMCISTMFTKI